MSEEQSGLRDESQVETYINQTYGSAVSSMSADDRAAQVMKAVNERLAAVGVPHVDWVWEQGSPAAGHFSFRDWTMKLGSKAFDPSAYEAAKVADHADLLDTVYHEARHSEQWWRQARERAGLGASVAEIVLVTKIKESIATAAAANPITECDRSQYEAEAWYQSVYGSGAHHRGEVLKDVDHRYDEYRALPEEKDAWAAGGQVTSAYEERGETGNE